VTTAACTVCGRLGLSLSGGRCGTCYARSRQEPCADCGNVRVIARRTDAGDGLCGTCVDRRAAGQRTAILHLQAAITLGSWLPALDEVRVLDAVERAAPTFRQAGWLVAALTDLEVLHASTTAPRVIDRLVVELVAIGAVGIDGPTCVGCGRSAWLTQRLDGHRACANCAQRQRGEVCGHCGRMREVATRDANGASVCGGCLQQDRTRWHPCARCGTLCRPARRLTDTTVLCRSCNRPTAICVDCGLSRPCDGIRSGTFRCAPCSRRQVPCSWCGRTGKVAVVWATGPVCTSCHHKGLEAKAVCAGCGELRRPDPRHPSRRCADCVGLARFSVCSGCGLEDRVYRNGHCWRCTLGDTFDALTASGSIDLTPLRMTLLATDRARAVVRWLDTLRSRQRLTTIDRRVGADAPSDRRAWRQPRRRASTRRTRQRWSAPGSRRDRRPARALDRRSNRCPRR
jgi:hypothetical protein